MNKPDSISFLTEQADKLKIAVVGDVMLDCYYYGEVKRISPEAPVPVTRVTGQSASLGGAANVAANLAFLGAKVYLGGVSGLDENRGKLLDLLNKAAIDSSGLITGQERKTITKLRILGSNQQMLRLDFEETGVLSPQEECSLQTWFKGLVANGLDGLVISDYAKGVCSSTICPWLIQKAHEANIPVLVDPKGSEWAKYQGADCITPNVKEMGEAVGRVLPNETLQIVNAARDAICQYGVASVLVTRSEKGLSFVAEEEAFTVPAAAREVYDVSGAGDTVAAVFLATLAGGLPSGEAALLANQAAGIVVGRVGTYAIRRDELLNEVLCEERSAGKKYRPLNRREVEMLAAGWRQRGERVVFTNGCFDILHTGHVTYLEKARALGDHLIIGLNSDNSVKKLKGETRPLVCELDRARVLSALGCVDAVVLFAEDTPEELLSAVKPDVLVKGGDYAVDEVAGRQYAGEVKIIDFEEGYSTTGVIEKIRKLVEGGKL